MVKFSTQKDGLVTRKSYRNEYFFRGSATRKIWIREVGKWGDADSSPVKDQPYKPHVEVAVEILASHFRGIGNATDCPSNLQEKSFKI